jgi:trk system potassium uptake protein TrkH
VSKRSAFDGSRKIDNLLLHVAGLVTAVTGVAILLSTVVEILTSGPHVLALLVLGTITTILGAVAWGTTAIPKRIQVVDVFITVTGAWVFLAIAGALPYLVTGTLEGVDYALFESISGFTTTGATVLAPIEGTSQGVLFFRSISQWMGGMGVIVLVVAVLPTVGAGGMNLLEAEAPGPTGERLTPRVRNTARRLWGLYLGFTISVFLAYVIAGMSVYDAISHSFTTVSTGGFSPYDASIHHFDSGLIEWIAIVSMFIAGTSFTLLYRAIRGKPGAFLESSEFKLYLGVVAVATIIVMFTAGSDLDSSWDGLRDALFTVNAIVSTTGYATADFQIWGDASKVILLLLMPLGGMAGSTAGGVKMIRLMAVGSFTRREALRQLHPRIVRPVRVGSYSLTDAVAFQVLGFLVLALSIFGLAALLFAITGADLVTSFSAAATSIGNVGPGLNAIGPTQNFTFIPRAGIPIAFVTMILGRLEIYPVVLALIAFTRASPATLRRQVENSRTSLSVKKSRP